MKKTRVARETRAALEITTIPLNKGLAERLRYAAEWKGIELQEAAEQAVTQYLGRFGREKIEAEQRAFEKMRADLLTRYRGEYVAVHNGEVVEHAPDLNALHKKVFARFGFTPILHIQVTDEPQRELRTHGLRFVQEAH